MLNWGFGSGRNESGGAPKGQGGATIGLSARPIVLLELTIKIL